MTFEMVYEIFETLFFCEVNFMIPVAYMPLLLWFAIRAHNSDETNGLIVNFKGPIIIHSSLNIFVTFVWILIYGEHHLNHGSPWFRIFDAGAPLGIFLLLVVIPIGLIAAWWIGPKRRNSKVKKPAYIFASRIYYVISAIPSFYLILFFTGMATAK